MIGAVLCGGRSRRFGTDKAVAEAGGQPLGSWVVTAMREAGADPVVAVGGTAGLTLGVPTISDRWPDAGPLAALATVLLWARTGLVVVAPCDLPLVRADHIRILIDAATATSAAVARPEPGDRPQPSLACWPAAAGPSVLALVEAGHRTWRSALDVVTWTPVPVPAAALSDADTPSDLALLLGEGRAGEPGRKEEPGPAAP